MISSKSYGNNLKFQNQGRRNSLILYWEPPLIRLHYFLTPKINDYWASHFAGPPPLRALPFFSLQLQNDIGISFGSVQLFTKPSWKILITLVTQYHIGDASEGEGKIGDT